jgi:hypothetical protein
LIANERVKGYCTATGFCLGKNEEKKSIFLLVKISHLSACSEAKFRQNNKENACPTLRRQGPLIANEKVKAHLTATGLSWEI